MKLNRRKEWKCFGPFTSPPPMNNRQIIYKSESTRRQMRSDRRHTTWQFSAEMNYRLPVMISTPSKVRQISSFYALLCALSSETIECLPRLPSSSSFYYYARSYKKKWQRWCQKTEEARRDLWILFFLFCIRF